MHCLDIESIRGLNVALWKKASTGTDFGNGPFSPNWRLPARQLALEGGCLYASDMASGAHQPTSYFNRTTAVINRVASLGRCPGPRQWAQEPTLDCQTWRKVQGSRLAINGVEMHRTHSLKWYRGFTYCVKCGHYSSGRKVRNLVFTCKLRVAPSTKYRLNRIKTKK